MPTSTHQHYPAPFTSSAETCSILLRAQHKLFTTLPADVTPPELTRLAHARARELARRRLRGRTSVWPQLWAGSPRIVLAVLASGLLLLASRQVML